MKHRIVVFMVACCVIASFHATAWASWAAPVGAVRVLLGYGLPYASGTHRGIDLAAAVASDVIAPAAGTVTFAGSIPADGGGTCKAITIETVDGLRVSLLPLEMLMVEQGAAIGVGDAVGRVAASGDNSTSDSHIHIGLRRGEVYLDPSSLLPLSGATASPAASTIDVPASSPAPGAAATAGQLAAGASGDAVAIQPAAVQDAASASGPTVPEVSALSARPLSHVVPADAGIPNPSALRPDLRPATNNVQLSLGAPSPQLLRSTLLALAMIAVAALVAVPRLAAVRQS